MQHKLWLFALFACLTTMFALAGLALAAEFSADVIMKGDPMFGQGKVWVKGQKMRQEMGDPAGKMIMIMDLDQGFHWVLMPQSKTYMKTEINSKGEGFTPENFTGTQQGSMEAEVKRLGTETVGGYKCDKYLVTFKDKKMGTMTQWFSKKLNYPIKMINKSSMMGEVVTELQNIKIGSVKDALFKIPPGYTEMKLPQIPQMPVINQ
jgi:outer membrane lipoprotein-sorting protein